MVVGTVVGRVAAGAGLVPCDAAGEWHCYAELSVEADPVLSLGQFVVV